MKHSLALLISAVLSQAVFAQEAARDRDKWRILVDKVVSASTQPRLTNAQVREVARAGFNVFIPRQGGTNLAAVKEGGRLAAKNGIKYMAWLRGSAYTRDPQQMMVWADGVTGSKALCSPNSDEMWNRIIRLLEGHARLSLKHRAIVGTFLDFENYDTHGGYGHCYSLSYDDMILSRFAKKAGIEIPKLALKDRWSWLVKQKLHDAFASFQKSEWRKRCQEIRRRIDVINPAFRLAVYPVPGPLFLEEAAFRAFSTQRAPLILADACTYGRPLQFLSDRAALRENRRKLLDHIAYIHKRGFPFQYVGGIDPIVEPGDPEFVAKNADMIASVSDGYWVFYEGPTYGKDDHRQMFDWLGRANESIRRHRFHLHAQRRIAVPPRRMRTLKRVSGKRLVMHEGVNIGMHKALNRTGKYQSHFLQSLDVDYLKKADAVWIQSGIRWMDCDSQLLANLRTYVKQGGSLLISHLGWAKTGCAHQSGRRLLDIHSPFAARLFSEIATWSGPTHRESRGPFVLDNRLTMVTPATISCPLPIGTAFRTSSPNHMILHAGKAGIVIAKDSHGDPVCVAGRVGKGRLILCGCFYGYWQPTRPQMFSDPKEQRLFHAMLDWLTRKR